MCEKAFLILRSKYFLLQSLFMMMLSSDGERQEVLASSAAVDSAEATSVSGADSVQVPGRTDSTPLMQSEFDLPSLPARMTNAADGMGEAGIRRVLEGRFWSDSQRQDWIDRNNTIILRCFKSLEDEVDVLSGV